MARGRCGPLCVGLPPHCSPPVCSAVLGFSVLMSLQVTGDRACCTQSAGRGGGPCIISVFRMQCRDIQSKPFGPLWLRHISDCLPHTECPAQWPWGVVALGCAVQQRPATSLVPAAAGPGGSAVTTTGPGVEGSQKVMQTCFLCCGQTHT